MQEQIPYESAKAMYLVDNIDKYHLERIEEKWFYFYYDYDF